MSGGGIKTQKVPLTGESRFAIIPKRVFKLYRRDPRGKGEENNLLQGLLINFRKGGRFWQALI